MHGYLLSDICSTLLFLRVKFLVLYRLGVSRIVFGNLSPIFLRDKNWISRSIFSYSIQEHEVRKKGKWVLHWDEIFGHILESFWAKINSKKARIYQAFEIVSASAYVAIVSMLKACIDNFRKNKFAIWHRQV